MKNETYLLKKEKGNISTMVEIDYLTEYTVEIYVVSVNTLTLESHEVDLISYTQDINTQANKGIKICESNVR